MNRIFIVFASLSLLCGCETVMNLFRPRETEDPSDQYVIHTDGIPRVRVGVGIVVQVGAVAHQPTTMQVQVDQNGEITLPYLLEKPVYCHELTLDALKKKLVKEYQAYIKQPQVTVTFAPYDGRGVSPWGTVTVLGEVGSPGPVNMTQTMELTVTKALKEAGGLRPYANKRKIHVTSYDKNGNKTRRIVDVLEIGETGDAAKDIRLKAGDVVWVPESWY